MKVLITGGTGLVGTKLTDLLMDKGYEVAHVSRSSGMGKIRKFKWDIDNGELEDGALDGVDAVVHLAGAGVADGRWTDSRKKEILESRTKSTDVLINALSTNTHEVKSFIAASAVGYYGMDTGDKLCTEGSSRGSDFLSDVVVEWERATGKVRELQIPTTQLRIGVVLDPKGGALGKMETPLKMGFGSPLGSGKQWMSWIHIEDLCQMIVFALENKLDDVYNAVAPNPATNRELTKAMAKVMKKPLFMANVPSFVIKAVFGEMANMILGGNKVSADKIQTAGFKFSFNQVEEALEDLY